MTLRFLRSAAALTLVLVALPLAGQTPPYDRTVIVGGSAAPAVNGTNLLNALAAIPAPGPANRWLVKVEPGIFDLGTQALALRDYVDVEGSGRGVTVVTSAILETSAPGATVYAGFGVHTEVRELTARNTASNRGTAVGVFANSARLTRIDAERDTIGGGAAVILDTCTAELVEVTVRLKAASLGGLLAGVYTVGGGPRLSGVVVTGSVPSSGILRGAVFIDSAATVDRLTVSAPVAAVANQQEIGIEITRTGGGAGPANQPLITNSNLTLGGTQCYGILVSGGAQPEIRDTVATASVAWFGYGLSVRSGSKATVYGSRLRGQGSLTGVGVHLDGAASAADLHHSTVDGSSNAYSTTNGALPSALSFGASQLIGTRPGGANCVFSYDGGFAPLNGPC